MMSGVAKVRWFPRIVNVIVTTPIKVFRTFLLLSAGHWMFVCVLLSLLCQQKSWQQFGYEMKFSMILCCVQLRLGSHRSTEHACRKESVGVIVRAETKSVKSAQVTNINQSKSRGWKVKTTIILTYDRKWKQKLKKHQSMRKITWVWNFLETIFFR